MNHERHERDGASRHSLCHDRFVTKGDRGLRELPPVFIPVAHALFDSRPNAEERTGWSISGFCLQHPILCAACASQLRALRDSKTCLRSLSSKANSLRPMKTRNLL